MYFIYLYINDYKYKKKINEKGYFFHLFFNLPSSLGCPVGDFIASRRYSDSK